MVRIELLLWLWGSLKGIFILNLNKKLVILIKLCSIATKFIGFVNNMLRKNRTLEIKINLIIDNNYLSHR